MSAKGKEIEIVDGKVKCEVCGKWMKRISNHVRMHGLTPDDYRAKFGFSLGANLDAERGTNGGQKGKAWTIKKKYPDGFYDIDEIDLG